ncbi:MAG: response regulator transcription factor [Elainellaceae cyanobacterium]
MNARIVLVENQPDFAQQIEETLQKSNFCVKTAQTGFSGLSALRESRPDAVLLDWTLPDISGLDICRRLRSAGNKIPVILLNESQTISDRVVGLDAGADDYLVKPFSPEELSARVRALLRRVRRMQNTKILKIDDLSLDPDAREVYRGSDPISLTAKEFDLLAYLMEHPHQVITRDQILEHVWQYEYIGSSNIIEVYIRYLRRKLEINQNRRLIHTVRGVGYVLREPRIPAFPLSAA